MNAPCELRKPDAVVHAQGDLADHISRTRPNDSSTQYFVRALSSTYFHETRRDAFALTAVNVFQLALIRHVPNYMCWAEQRQQEE